MIVKEKGDLEIKIIAYIIVFGTPFCYYLRKKKPFDLIWKLLSAFWIVLVAVLINNKINDSNKRK